MAERAKPAAPPAGAGTEPPRRVLPPRPRAHPDRPERSFTLMLVPDRGHGRVWQVRVPLRRARQAVAALGVLASALALALVGQALTLPRVLAHDALVGENLAMKAELDEMHDRLAEMDTLVERVRTYDDRLRELGGRGLLPGFGPLDDDEADAWRAWLSGLDVPDAPLGDEPDLQRLDRLARSFSALEPEIASLSGPIESWAALEAALPHLWPSDGVVTSLFGWRRSPFNRRWKFHSGIDIGAHYGTPIQATSPGVVVFADWHSGLGRMVEIDHGGGIATRSCHASRLLVAAGDEVEAGDIVALVGSSGQSTGAHLHYELLLDGEQVDPLDYLPRGE